MGTSNRKAVAKFNNDTPERKEVSRFSVDDKRMDREPLRDKTPDMMSSQSDQA